MANLQSPVKEKFEFLVNKSNEQFENGKHTFINDTGYRAGNDWVLIITDASKSYVQDNLSEKN